MTCIAAIKAGRMVYVGADSAGVANLNLTIRADDKVFYNGDFLFGFTSSFRMGQLLRYDFKPPANHCNDDEEYMVTQFVKSVRKCLRDGGFSKEKDKVEKGGTFIVAYRGEIYVIEDDFQVGRSTDNFAAVGCGSNYAKGVMWQLQRSRINPRQKIKAALQAAEHFSAGVQRPFKILVL